MQLFFEKAGSGPPFIIMHGLFGSSDNWRTVAKPLCQYFTVYFVDERNHGRSPQSDVHDYPHMAADLEALFVREKLGSAVVLGHSMGGKTAMQFAFSYPARVEKLIVVDMAPKAYPPHHDDVINALEHVPIAKIQTRQEAEEAMKPYLPDEAMRQFLLKSLYRITPESNPIEASRGQLFAWRFNFNGLVTAYSDIIAGVGYPGIDKFAGPVLFVRADHSYYYEPEELAGFRVFFPQAELVTIEGASHWIQADKPKEFLAALGKFLGLTLNL